MNMAELPTLLPWGTLVTMSTLIGYVIKISLTVGKVKDQAERADARSQKNSERQAAFELEVSKTYVRDESLRMVVDKIDRLGDRLGDRIDRAIENAANARHPA